MVKSYIIVSSRHYYIKDLTKLYKQAGSSGLYAINRTSHNVLAHAGAYSHCGLVFYPTRGVPSVGAEQLTFESDREHPH